MRPFRMLISLVLMLLFFTVLSQAAAQDDISWLLDQINCLRQSVGSPPLTMNVALSVAANRQAVNLVSDDLTDFHVGLDGSTPLIRAREAGFTGSVGENVSGGGNARDAFNWWLNSPVHYDNMTNAHWKEIGIGTARGTYGSWYTLVFGAMNWQVTEPVSTDPCDELDAPPESAVIEDTLPEASISGPLENIQIETSSDTVESAEPLPTPVILGLDENGYIQHVIQSGETPGTVMLSYGYSWDYLPTLMALNNMTEADARNLDVGDIFLIPPGDSTFTPNPADSSEDTFTPMLDNQDTGLIILVISDTPSAIVLPSSTPMPTLTTAPSTISPQSPPVSETLVPAVAFVASLTPTKTLLPPVVFAASLTPTLDLAGTLFTSGAPATASPPLVPLVMPEPLEDKTSLLLTIAIVLQVVILGVAAFEGVRRSRKRR